ncbi:apolipoprotein N-acyltransferase [Thiosulfatimonas sediminis]|uniref:Apolipoprotein N-acyltransferase n=1 Tax=Thiosulfatimonas sediminis TaxID=2675054 RepID=A0A6F8PX72_9GAMM|nr:apolipoprotein N-acyltransferase [Thiosulfatimonas sediminis]BBP46719.1 apolipoprotein N-acyltransferase [Thiosulfatimonas sediminis]
MNKLTRAWQAITSGLARFKPNKSHWLALLLGAVSVSAFAPLAIAPVMLLTLAGLFVLWQKSPTAKDGAKLGLYFGLGFFGVGLSWLFKSIYVYSGVVLPIAVLLTLSWVLYHALFLTAAGYFAVKLRGSRTLAMLGLFPVVWVLFELLRGTLFGGYPFLLIGVSHLHSWLDGYAPIFGVWGVSWVVAVSAGALALLYLKRSWVLSSLVICLLWSSGGLLQQIQWVSPVAKPVDIALVQGNVPQQLKWTTQALVPSLERYTQLTKANLDADVIVWPETAVANYLAVVEKGALQTFIRDAQLFKKDILVGVVDGDPNGDAVYNALVNLGNLEQRYHKRHLVPFSEYFPFDAFFAPIAKLFDIPFSFFSHGDASQMPLQIGNHQVGLSICFEMAFGEELARQLPVAEYFITVSNDGWFAHTLEPHQQLQDVQMRALELGREIARATNTGFTVIVGVDGQIKAQVAPYQLAVLRGEIQPYQGLTPYAQWQWLPILLLIGLILLFTLGGRLLLRRH